MTPWIICDGAKSGAFVCLRCAAEFALNLPLPFRVYIAQCDAFIGLHKGCKLPPQVTAR